MEHVFRSRTILIILFIIPFFNSCDKAESPVLEQASIVADHVVIDDVVAERATSAALNGHKIYFSSEPMTVSFAEFELINLRILQEGFSVANGCNYISSETAGSQAEWENSVGASYESILWDEDTNTTTFRYVDIPFAEYGCGEIINPNGSPFCYYLFDNTEDYLNIFIGDNVYDCLLGNFTVYGSTVHATINLQPLVLSLSGQGCSPTCFGN